MCKCERARRALGAKIGDARLPPAEGAVGAGCKSKGVGVVVAHKRRKELEPELRGSCVSKCQL